MQRLGLLLPPVYVNKWGATTGYLSYAKRNLTSWIMAPESGIFSW